MDSRFSIVLPVKNELELLRSSLASCYAVAPDEVVVCLDDPPDVAVLNEVKRVSKRCDSIDRTKIISVARNREYRSHLAWITRQGFLNASYDRILSVDADLILNRNVHKALSCVGGNNVGYASCTTMYPVTDSMSFFRAVVHGLVTRFRPPPLTGLYALWRPYWLDSEDAGIKLLEYTLESVVRGSMVVIGQDTYLLNCMRAKHRAIHLRKVGAYSMRPYHNLAKHTQYELGRYYAASGRRFGEVLLKSVALLQPYLLVGYSDQKTKPSEIPIFNPDTFPF